MNPPLPPFLECLQERPLVFDGAMGTMLYERGYFINRAFDEANLTNPEAVTGIHAANLEAGAEILETNTFSANRYLLARYGAQDQVREINRRGVALARAAAAGRAYVAGSVGPTGEGLGVLGQSRLLEIRRAYEEQIGALLDAGVDLLVLETFHHLAEMRAALEVAKALFPGPIVAQMSFEEDGHLRDGSSPIAVAGLLGSWGAAVVGVNCCEGPAIVHEVACAMLPAGLPVSAQPNAGRPRRVDQRTLYMATPEYFGVYARRLYKAGVRLVGGCCGTRPEHIAAVAAAARMQGHPEPRLHPGAAVAAPGRPPPNLAPPVPLAERSALAAKVHRVFQERLASGACRQAPRGREDFVVSVEVNPPAGLDPARALAAAREVLAAGADVINIADGPRASVRMSNTAFAVLASRETGREVILHVCCRDRNLLGLQADVLGAHALGLHNLVVITGDPPKLGDYPKATAVFDLDSIELLKLVDGLNRGVDPAGKIVGEQTRFFLITGAEPAAQDYDRELARLERKVRAGASLVMTQPVYDPAVVERFLGDLRPLGIPVLLGLCPLVSARNAEFLHHEVPGMAIPEEVRRRMQEAGRGDGERAEGIRIAREMIEAFQDRVVGAYIMPQLGRHAAALEVLRPLGYGTPQA
jgi:methionine synthase I (cobalamin-dependent)/5,10-methylenetetrahydrofolate reductase